MGRKEHQFHGIAVLEDGTAPRYLAAGRITEEIMSEVVGCIVVQISHGYDFATDSHWPSFRQPNVPLETATEIIRKWNRDNPDSIFPSVPAP